MDDDNPRGLESPDTTHVLKPNQRILTDGGTDASDTERPYAFKWESAFGNEELLITDGSLKFWTDYGEIVSIVTWDDRNAKRCVRRGCASTADQKLTLDPEGVPATAPLCDEHYQEAIDDRSLNTETDDPDIATDGGVSWADLSGFQRDLLEAIIRLERDGTPLSGRAIQDKLEARYGDLNHGRLYPNLDDLVRYGLVTKGQLDRRTNEYRPTAAGRALMIQRAERLADACEIAPALPDGGRA